MAKTKGQKPKKQKVTYYDDNSTIADMSGVGAFGAQNTTATPSASKKGGNVTKPRATFKEKWATYFAAVKTMFLPMIVVLIAICAFFLVLYLISLGVNG